MIRPQGVSLLLHSHSLGQICTSHQPTKNTNKACLPPQPRPQQLWGSSCDSNHKPTISVKFIHFHGDFGNFFRHMIQVLSRHTSSPTRDHPRYFKLCRPYFLQNLHISANPYQNKPFQASNTKYSKNKPKRPDAFNYANYDTQGIKFQRYAYQNIDSGGRGLTAWSTFTHGCKHSSSSSFCMW